MTQRPRHEMPEDVRVALKEHRLRDAYDARPPYQRNDYLGWIGGAVQDETRAKRVHQMLNELQVGTTYMNMDWKPGED